MWNDVVGKAEGFVQQEIWIEFERQRATEVEDEMAIKKAYM